MRRARPRVTSGLLAILFAGSPLAAQQGSAVDAGFAVVSFPGDAGTMMGPWLRAVAERDALAVRSRVSAAVVAGRTGFSGSADAESWRQGSIAEFRWEAGGEGAALLDATGRPRESVLAGVRVARAVGGDGGLWLRATSHAAFRESGLLRGASASVGGWWRSPAALLTATVTRQRAQGQLFESLLRDRVLGVVPVRYVEGLISARREVDAGSLEISAGARRDPDASARMEALLSLSALWWTSTNTAVVVNASRQPADYVHGGDAMQLFSVGMRFGARGGHRPMAPTAGPTLSIVSGQGPARFRIRAPGAHAVELMGDFTQWESASLTPAAGEFVLDRDVPPGPHRVLVRIDGGAWTVPVNTPSVDDELGGRVGLVVVP